jgi:hypothetical protein
MRTKRVTFRSWSALSRGPEEKSGQISVAHKAAPLRRSRLRTPCGGTCPTPACLDCPPRRCECCQALNRDASHADAKSQAIPPRTHDGMGCSWAHGALRSRSGTQGGARAVARAKAGRRQHDGKLPAHASPWGRRSGRRWRRPGHGEASAEGWRRCCSRFRSASRGQDSGSKCASLRPRRPCAEGKTSSGALYRAFRIGCTLWHGRHACLRRRLGALARPCHTLVRRRLGRLALPCHSLVPADPTSSLAISSFQFVRRRISLARCRICQTLLVVRSPAPRSPMRGVI